MQEKKTVLLIDDDPEEFELFCVALERYNSNISCIHTLSCSELKKVIGNKKIDYVLLDFNLPEMNGFECLKSFREMGYFQDVPIYMYSASSIIPAISELCVTAGALKWICKPKNMQGYFQIFNDVFK